MKTRRLLQESTSPAVCAFCAYQLGQNGATAHINRRFLQSSRSVSKPPTEATAVRDTDDGNTSKAPFAGSWDGMSSNSNQASAQPTWGRSGAGSAVLSSGPSFGTWGRPGQQSGGVSSRGHSSAQVSSQNSTPEDNLLPHERLARQATIGKAAEEAQREVYIHAGPGPQSTRAGRPTVLEDGKKREHHNNRHRYLARIINSRTKQSSESFGPKIRKHLGGDSRYEKVRQVINKNLSLENHSNNMKLPERSDHEEVTDANQWSMLKRKGTTEHQDGMKVLLSDFNAFPGPTDDEASTTRYTPLIKNAASTSSGPVSDQANYWNSGVRSSPSTVISGISTTPQDPSELVSWKPLRVSTSTDSQSAVINKSEEPRKYFVQEDTEKAQLHSDTPKKNRVRRGGDFQDMTFEDNLRAKGRIKARRRQHFASEEEDISEEAAQRAEKKRLRKLEKAAEKAAAPTPILLPEFISVSNLAAALKVKLEQFIHKMESLGFDETSHDHILNGENAGLIAQEYNYEPIIDRSEAEDLKAREPPKNPSKLPQRPPVITIMGHVDHGKTTLLDWLRKSSVVASEHGGITQHIGAFSVTMPSGKVITFLDTPGHAAFLSMRQRGANVTDIVILVVAADDSVKPQTIEAINHAKSANVPIIVAINKVDKEEADINRVKLDLGRHGIDVEDFGGDTQVVCVSGKTGQGMEALEEATVTLSEILDMRAEKSGPAEGWVLEASIKARGKVATILVRRGTVRPGDFIVAGKTWARIRCLRNEAGVEISKAGPGTPVEIDGWREQPEAGDEVLQAPDEAKAKSVVEYRLSKTVRDRMAQDMEAINETRRTEQEKKTNQKAEQAAAKDAHDDLAFPTIPEPKANGPKEVYFIVKADVSGSVEAVTDSISALGTGEVRAHILRSGVGQLGEFDVEHAAAAKGVLVNFNTAIEPQVVRMAKENKVPIVDANIIYKLVDEVKAEMSKVLPPIVTTRVLGEADIAQVFSITVKGRQQKAVAGCKVRNGTVGRTAKVRVLRLGEKIFDGTIATLKNVKKDVPEMKKGGECGIGFEDFTDFQIGDQVQAYEEVVEKRFL